MMTPVSTAGTLSSVRKVLVLLTLYGILAMETYVSAGFSIRPPSARQNTLGRSQFNTQSHRLGRVVENPDVGLSKTHRQSTVAIRGGGRRAAKEDSAGAGASAAAEEQLSDFGGKVASLFGNLRIPASLVAGAALGSAFALPLADSDGFMMGFAKRLYAFSMLTSLGSMLLVVILSTICMNDIAMCPSRLSKSAYDYVSENYSMEWFAVKSHFFYGAVAFTLGAAFRAYVSISCPIIGRGIGGMLVGTTMISLSHLIEKSENQRGGSSIWQAFARHLRAILNKSKTNVFYAAGVLVWASSLSYLTYKLPHIYLYLSRL